MHQWNDCTTQASASKAVDITLVLSAMRAFQQHLLYLAAETVPLALFIEGTPPETRQSVANRLLEISSNPKPQDRYGTIYERKIDRI